MRLVRLLIMGLLAGGVWYLVLSLPISPITYEFLVETRSWPSLITIVELALASAIAAISLMRLFVSSRVDVVVLGGVLYALLSGVLFALVTLTSWVLYGLVTSEAVYPTYGKPPGPDLFIEAIFIAGFGFMYALFSEHVSIPTGIGLAFVFRWALHQHPTSSRELN